MIFKFDPIGNHRLDIAGASRLTAMKVSAYIPCYNARGTLLQAVQSILEQTVAVDELFVVDDGSTDGSGDLSEVRVIRVDSNEGRGAARARAMAEATHELVLGCDATLVLDRRFLENALPWFTDDRVAAVFGWVKEGVSGTVANRWRGRHLFRSHNPPELNHRASLAACCTVIRKSTAQEVGGYGPHLRAGEDADLGRRLLSAGYDVVHDPSLFATSVSDNSVLEVLERYVRWHDRGRMSMRTYLQVLQYALKVMVMKDLKARDPLSACVSLLVPHWQFWSRVVASLHPLSWPGAVQGRFASVREGRWPWSR